MILISVPTFDGHIELETIQYIFSECKQRNDIDFMPIHGYDVASARNYAVKEAIKGGYDYLFFIDSDTVPPENTLEMLLERNRDVIVGAYTYGPNPEKSIVSRTVDPRGLIYDEDRLIPCYEIHSYNGIEIQIGCSGMGCALIKTNLLKKMEEPWFKWFIYDDGEELGEDCYFAEKLRLMNIPMYLDTRVLCGHVKKHIYRV